MASSPLWLLPACLVSVLVLSVYAMGLFSRKNRFPLDRRTVLLTGGSQGMGKSVARLLSQKGANIAIVARDIQKLEAALVEVKAAAVHGDAQRFAIFSADLTQASEHARLFADVTKWNSGQPPDIVFAVAGSAAPMLYVEATPELLKSQMDTNFFSAAFLARETIRAWIEPASPSPSRKQTPVDPPARHLVMTSSNAAFAGIAGYGPYCPSKAAIRALSDTLRSEVQLYNGARLATNPSTPPPPADIEVHTVFPGTTTSPGLEQENRLKHASTHMLEDMDPVQTPDEAAAAAIKGLEAGEYLVVTNVLSMAMRASAWMGSPRHRLWLDLPLQWLSGLIWLFVILDQDRQLRNYGKKYGMEGARGTGILEKKK